MTTDDGDSDTASASVRWYKGKCLCAMTMLEKKLQVQW